MIAMPRILLAGAAAGLFAAVVPSDADDIPSIATPGTGDLTMCSYRGCNLYHHIKLPNRIAVGDTVRVTFGSNPKDYAFPVVHITRDGDTCTVLSAPADDATPADKIEVASCRAAAGSD